MDVFTECKKKIIEDRMEGEKSINTEASYRRRGLTTWKLKKSYRKTLSSHVEKILKASHCRQQD